MNGFERPEENWTSLPLRVFSRRSAGAVRPPANRHCQFSPSSSPSFSSPDQPSPYLSAFAPSRRTVAPGAGSSFTHHHFCARRQLELAAHDHHLASLHALGDHRQIALGLAGLAPGADRAWNRASPRKRKDRFGPSGPRCSGPAWRLSRYPGSDGPARIAKARARGRGLA